MQLKEKAPHKARQEMQGERITDTTMVNMVRYRDMLSSFVYELDCAIERYCQRHCLNVETFEEDARQGEGSDLPEEISEETYIELYEYVIRSMQYSPMIPVNVLSKHIKIVQR